MKDLFSLGLRYQNGKLQILDQTRLPAEEEWISIANPDGMIAQIQRLAIRGAPLIGVAAAIALAQYAESGASESDFRAAAERLRGSRPTAVNLMHAVDRMLQLEPYSTAAAQSEAEKIFAEDVLLCDGMGERAASLINHGDGVLTHCNSGGLATAGRGTALGAIRLAHEMGKSIHVYVDETRPLLQGARLTAWELDRARIPFTVICDNMAGFLMAQKKVNRIFVGADRIARNGDVANKIGTYGLAVLAHHHRIPFHVVAPSTTFDRHCATGADIPIEQRAGSEVTAASLPFGQAWNPAFDVTPRHLITSIIFEDRVM